MELIRTAAYIPKDFIGIIGLKALARKATAVVLDVIAVSLAALLNEYANLLCGSSRIYLILWVYLHPSINTNIPSAPMPRIMNTKMACTF